MMRTEILSIYPYIFDANYDYKDEYEIRVVYVDCWDFSLNTANAYILILVSNWFMGS
jgi:hypothetical protein